MIAKEVEKSVEQFGFLGEVRFRGGGINPVELAVGHEGTPLESSGSAGVIGVSPEATAKVGK